ncbi:MAG: 3-hydroxyacyl-CoA dehydrogenase NAD-binding domain-containing protein [Syntrophotaleaceae bacterium]
MTIRKVVVVGAGAMGTGIARAAAAGGFEVLLQDRDQAKAETGRQSIRVSLEKQVAKGRMEEAGKEALLSRIRLCSSLDECAGSDLVIEAVVENEDVKQGIFRSLDAVCPPHTLFASNTSSISITRLASVTTRPEQVIGMHFMNPAHVMKLVEVITGLVTSPATTEKVCQVAEQMGKTPVLVNDCPGFVANRVLMPMINDAIFCLQEGVADRDAIDEITRLGANHPMGPLELADFIGLDVCLEILKVLHRELGEKYRPCTLLRNMVAAGRLGRKSGCGFYDYRESRKS